jgi:hypothetical protein
MTTTSLDTLKELIAQGRVLSPDESQELINRLTREDVSAMTLEEYLRIYPKNKPRQQDHRTWASIVDLEATTLSRLFPELDEFVAACVVWLGTEEDGNMIESSFASLPAVIRITAWCRLARWLIDNDDGHATYHRKVHRHLQGLMFEAFGEADACQ